MLFVPKYVKQQSASHFFEWNEILERQEKQQIDKSTRWARIIWHAKHYTGRGVMKFYPSGEDLAKDMGVPLQTLIDTHQKHFEAAKKQDAHTVFFFFFCLLFILDHFGVYMYF